MFVSDPVVIFILRVFRRKNNPTVGYNVLIY